MRRLALIFLCALGHSAGAADSFAIRPERVPEIVLQGEFRPFVMKAAQDVAGDIEKIFGVRPEVRCDGVAPKGDAIVLTREGNGWENYALESRPGNVLRITGSDDRGVMFGLYRFASECLGVDPFYFWSGREPEKSTGREWKDGISIRQGDPAFRFRGWFVNDEDFLNGFRPEENGRREIDYPLYHVCFGPKLADRIYEAAVRAGFNLMVCASYVDILNPDEKRLVDVASARGLYITMHHQEPVGAGALFLDLHFPEMKGTTYASHPDLWRKAWKTYVGEWAKVPDVVWQIGLRGRKDRPFWTVLKDGVGWTDWGKESPEEDRRRAGLISRAMREQVEMIREATGSDAFFSATQLWMEGADLYRKGLLEVPKRTTVMFSDNSPGLKFQPDLGGVKDHLPADRPYGLYYHLAVVCGNHFCELVPPFRTRQVVLDAWKKGARDLVLINVSNVRPFLFTIGAAADLARDGERFDPEDFCAHWCAARFGAGAKAAAHAFDLYFSAYETELSRDAVSAYGSPRERAPLAILNDGDLYSRIMFVILPMLRATPPVGGLAVRSAYAEDPDALTDVSARAHDRINQDMFPCLRDWTRYAARASAQATGFRRCLDQVELASSLMTADEKRQFFERLGYPAGFMYHASTCLAELALAAAARQEGNLPAARKHLASALVASRARDALDRDYNAGKWARWYSRDLKYPYTGLSAAIQGVLRGLESTNDVHQSSKSNRVKQGE